MPHHPPQPNDFPLTRRELLRRGGMGFGLIGLAGVLADDGRWPGHRPAAATTTSTRSRPEAAALPGEGQAGRPPVHERRAVARRYLRPQAAAGQVPRQAAAEPEPAAPSARPARRCARRSRSGGTARAASRSASCSPARPQHIDDMCVIRSMHADVPNHEPSLMLMNCGDGRLHAAEHGVWVTYGLGSENQNLPGFIVMCPGGYPIVGHAELAVGASCPAPTRGPTSTPSTPTSTS